MSYLSHLDEHFREQNPLFDLCALDYLCSDPFAHLQSKSLEEEI